MAKPIRHRLWKKKGVRLPARIEGWVERYKTHPGAVTRWVWAIASTHLTTTLFRVRTNSRFWLAN